MCDTFVIRRNGKMLFGKNSDREPGEPQLVIRIPPVFRDLQKKLAATYITIDQTNHRHGVLLSKPSWIWGAEMGANDRGVVIGNEAVFTRVMEKTDGLIGMDLVRLGLERGDDAEHALHVITGLLEAHGQGGICGFRDKRFRYDNSFIITDPENAWVLETAGRHWAAKKVANYAAISNCLTIGTDYDMTSAGIEDFAKDKGYFKAKGPLDFQAAL
jgi:secernin